MKILSARGLRELELAAELRAAGATWDTVAENLGRRPRALRRLAADHPETWERLLRDAEARLIHQSDNEARSVMRGLLRHEDARVRLGAADKLARRRLEELKRRGPPAPPAELAALLTQVQEMSDEELEHALAEFIRRVGGAAEVAAADAPGPAGAAGSG